MLRARLSIAGVSLGLRVHGPVDRARFQHRFAAYETASGPTHGELTVWIRRDGKLVEAPGTTYPGMRAYVTPQGVKLLREGLSLWLGDDHVAEAVVSGPEKPLALPYEEDAGPLDTPIRVLTSALLLRSGRGALLHASGCLHDAGALVFAGESGVGKTTLARSLSAAVLSDDQVAVTDAGAWRANATPFVGMLGRSIAPTSAPLSAVVLLDHERAGRVRRVPPAAARARLLRVLPLYTRSPADAGRALEMCARLAHDVPIVEGSPDLTRGVDVWLRDVLAAAR